MVYNGGGGTQALGEQVPIVLETLWPGVAGGRPEQNPLKCSAQGRVGRYLFFLVIINMELKL